MVKMALSAMIKQVMPTPPFDKGSKAICSVVGLATAVFIGCRRQGLFKIGSAADSPAPVGDPPTGTAENNLGKVPSPLAGTVAPIRSGKSPVCMRRTGRPDRT